MTHAQKIQLADAIEAYVDQHNLSQTELAHKSGVNASYIINIRKKDFTIKAGGKQTDIADKWFFRLAEFIGFETEKSYWKVQATDQMKGLLANLKDAKDNGEVTVIVGETGCGKTYISNMFHKKHPLDVFIVKVGASDNLGDLLDKIIDVLKVQVINRSKSARVRLIAKALKSMSENGLEPVLIFDESEYLKIPALCAMKELYDALNNWCALVLLGTGQLISNIEKLKRRNKPGIPQLYRRIKFRIRVLPVIDRSFKDFLRDIEPGLKRWLQQNCDNYGELHDVLVPAMREAERTGNELNEEFVKMVLGV